MVSAPVASGAMPFGVSLLELASYSRQRVVAVCLLLLLLWSKLEADDVAAASSSTIKLGWCLPDRGDADVPLLSGYRGGGFEEGRRSGRWIWPRSPLSLLVGDGGDGVPDSSLAQGWCCDGGRSGFAGSRIESPVADGRFIVAGSGDFVGRLLFSKAWWCSLLRVLWRLSFFFSGVAGGGGSKLVWWFSNFFVAVASVLCIQGCIPAYVIRIVLFSI